MNKKRFVTVGLAVAVAFLVVSVPYAQNSDAIIGTVAALIGIAAATSILANYVYDNWIAKNKQDSTSPAYTTDYKNYLAQWNNTISNTKYLLDRDEITANNMLNVLNSSKLFFVRGGEYLAMDVLNASTWDTYCENYVIQGFNDYMLNFTNTITVPYVVDMYDFLKTCQDIEVTNDGNIKVVFMDTSHNPARNSPIAYGNLDNRLVSVFVLNDDKYYWDIIPGTITDTTAWQFTEMKDAITHLENNDGTYKMVYRETDAFNTTYGVAFENTTDLTDYLDFIPKLLIHEIFNNGTYDLYICFNMTNYHNIWYYTAYNSAYQYEYGHGGSIEAYVNGNYSEPLSINDYIEWDNTLVNLYSSIKSDILINANSIWQTYKTAGYGNKSDIPPDEQVLFPDIALGDADALGNVTYNDSFPIWAAAMNSLSNSDLLNSSEISWDDVTIADYSGKIVNLTLTKYANTTNISDKTILINSERCYVMPHTSSLSLYVNKTYLISNTTTFSNQYANIVYDFNINQPITVYSLDTGKYYNINPSDNPVYTISINSITVDNVSVNSTTLTLIDVGSWLFPTPGGGDSPILPVIPSSSSSDLFSWLTNNKGLITIGLIVFGTIMTGSSKRNSSSHTLGILLLIAGIGLAIYWYVLPAMQTAGSVLNKLMFWR